MFSSDISEGYTTEDSEWSGSISSRCSSFGDVSVFGDDSPVRNASRNWAVKESKNVPPEKKRFSAQKLAVTSASQHFPKFVNSMTEKCAKLHWACHVGWCLCRYQYQPLTPLHLLPNTPITDRSVGLASYHKSQQNPGQIKFTPEKERNEQERLRIRLLTEGASYSEQNVTVQTAKMKTKI